MELKQEIELVMEQTRKLLIVPYGIETLKKDSIEAGGLLLIVPYGIETLKE